MDSHRLRLPLPALLLLALTPGCGPEPESPPLRVGEVAYTDDELLGLTDDRRALLAELTAFALAVARQETVGLGEPLLERRRRELLARLVRAERGLDSMGVDEALLREHYRRNPEWELTVRHLVALSGRNEDAEARAAARAKAARALERIRAGEPFSEVAAEVSEEPGAQPRQGLLQPGRRGAWVPEFWEAAVALRPGEVSRVVETQYGFHVLRLEERDTVPFEEARPRVLLEAAEMMGLADGESGPAVALPAEVDVDRGAVDRVEDPGAHDSLTVARWSGGRLSLGDLRDHLATLPRAEWRVVLDGDVQRRVDAVHETLHLRLAADSARARGLRVPVAAAAELERTWRQTAERWAAMLGFTAGGDVEAVKAAALQALRATNQNATLARQQLHLQAPLLLRAYEVRVREPPEEGSP